MSCWTRAVSAIFQTRCTAPYSSVTSAIGAEAAASSSEGVDRAIRVGVQHEELAEVRVRVAEQLHAVLLWAGKGLLVAVHDVGGILFDAAEGDEALADEALTGVGNGELLEVRIDARFRVAREHAGGDPVVQMRGGAGVDVLGRGVLGLALAEDHPHEIVRTDREVSCLHCRGDLVVRLGDDVPQRAGFFCVSKGVERVNASQVDRIPGEAGEAARPSRRVDFYGLRPTTAAGAGFAGMRSAGRATTPFLASSMFTP